MLDLDVAEALGFERPRAATLQIAYSIGCMISITYPGTTTVGAD